MAAVKGPQATQVTTLYKPIKGLNASGVGTPQSVSGAPETPPTPER